MAAVTVVFDGTRVNDANALGTVWLDLVGTAAVLEADFVYQTTNSVSEKVKTTEFGVKYFNSATNHNYTSPARTALIKALCATPSILSGTPSTSMIIEIGSGNRVNYYRYYVFTNATYPASESWQIIPIDPNLSAYRDATVGTPVLTAVDYYALAATMTATAKSENVAMDAIDFVSNGTGLTLTGGDGVDADGVFTNFVTTDEGTAGNRWGVVQSKGGILFVRGVLTIGTATATVFTDSNAVVVFPDGRFGTGFCGIDFGLQSATSVIALTNCVFRGLGAQGTNDTRPDYAVTGTSGTLTFSLCTFNVFRNMDLTSKVTLSDCTLLSGLKVTQSSAVIERCTFKSATTGDGVAFILSNDPSKISSCQFTFSDGHAIEITTPGTYAFVGNKFTGYGAGGSNDAAIYNNSGGAVTLNISGGGDTPTVRNGAGASTTVNNMADYTLTNLVSGTEVRIFRASDSVELAGVESSGTSFTYTHPVADAGTAIFVIVQKTSHEWLRIEDTLAAANKSQKVLQRADLNYVNP